jgi:hypothetical protein
MPSRLFGWGIGLDFEGHIPRGSGPWRFHCAAGRLRGIGKQGPRRVQTEFPINARQPLTARRTLHHVGCRTSAPLQAEFATPPLGRGDLSIAQCGDSYESLRGSGRGRAEIVCIFCAKVLHWLEAAKWGSSQIPQTAVVAGEGSEGTDGHSAIFSHRSIEGRMERYVVLCHGGGNADDRHKCGI